MQVYMVDEAGYLSDEFPAQKNRKRPGQYLLPPDAILTAPNKQDGYWPKWNNETEAWEYEKIPTCAADFLNLPPISHESQSPRDIKYRELIDKFKDDDETLTLKRGEEDLSWYMEKIPEKTLEEVRQEKLNELNSKFSQATAVRSLAWSSASTSASSARGPRSRPTPRPLSASPATTA